MCATARAPFRDRLSGIALLVPSSITPTPTRRQGCRRPGGRRRASTRLRSERWVAQAGRLKRLCIFIASPMSPEILSLPLMKAIWPFSFPIVMST